MQRSHYLLPLLVLVGMILGALPLPAQNTDVRVTELKSHDENLRAKAAHDLGKTGDPAAIPALTAALNDPSQNVRSEVILALGAIRDPASLQALVSAIQDPDPDLRVLAIRTVVGYYTGEKPSAGFGAFWKDKYHRAKGLFVPDITRVDPGVNADPEVVTGLLAALKDQRAARVAREAAKGLGTLVVQPAVPELVNGAHAADEDLAREALNALSKIKDPSAGPPLMDLLESPAKEVARDTAVTVGILRTQEALPRLQLMYENNPDPKTREKALEGLAYLGNRVSAPVFVKALWSVNDNLRTYAAEGLGRAADPKTLREIEKAISVEKKADPKLAMEFALATLGRTDYLSVMVDELGSKSRANTAQAYLQELTREPHSPALLYPYMNHSDAAVRKGICSVLMFTGNQSSMPELERLSRDPDSGVATEALRAMRAIRARTSATTPPRTSGKS
jgi:HEAT repeat protein